MATKNKRPTKAPANPVERYANVSTGILSVARHYGRAVVQNCLYHYDSVADELIREDVLRREGVWRVIRSVDADSRDAYALTTAKAKEASAFIAADRSGDVLGLFGPDGWVGFFRDGVNL